MTDLLNFIKRSLEELTLGLDGALNMSPAMEDVQERHAQLDKWTARSIERPKSVWLPGLFNAKAFITAVQQVYARANQLPLDVMKFHTEVTRLQPSDIEEYSEEGTYIH